LAGLLAFAFTITVLGYLRDKKNSPSTINFGSPNIGLISTDNADGNELFNFAGTFSGSPPKYQPKKLSRKVFRS
jgi:hypothetical protein